MRGMEKKPQDWACCGAVRLAGALWGHFGGSNSVGLALQCLCLHLVASERTGRQLIIHYNYKTPINPDIDSAIDPDQLVGRKEQEARAHNHTEDAHSLCCRVFNSRVLFFSAIFHSVHHSLL